MGERFTLGGVMKTVPTFQALNWCTLDKQQELTFNIQGVELTTFACLKTRSTLCPPARDFKLMELYLEQSTKPLWQAHKTTKLPVQSALSPHVR